ncbi:MAG: hypothetical protein ACYSTY_08400 [Planctomycetota bacterium]
MSAFRLHKVALRLAVLAIVANAAWLGSGGVVCLDASLLPPDCPDPCCEAADDCCPGEPAPVPGGPSDPAPPVCCISTSTGDWLPSQRSVQRLDQERALIHQSAAATPSPARRAFSTSDLSWMRRPPPMMWVGVILLQI